jgi:hypothetical protein
VDAVPSAPVGLKDRLHRFPPFRRLLDSVTRQDKISQRLCGSDRKGNNLAQFSTWVEHPIASAPLSNVFCQYE